MKKYIVPSLIVSFLLCCIQLTLFAMSPAVIASKQREFRKHIESLKKLNEEGEGKSTKANKIKNSAQQLINEMRPYTNVKWMETLLEAEKKQIETMFYEAANNTLKDISALLGNTEDKASPYFWDFHPKKEIQLKFFKKLSDYFDDMIVGIINLYGIDRKKETEWATRDGKSGSGGLFYLLNEHHKDFINFANIFGKTDKTFYKNNDTQINVLNSIKENLADLIYTVYYGIRNQEKFSLFQNNILKKPFTKSNIVKKLDQLKDNNLGGIFYNLQKDLNHYKNLMAFAGEETGVFNTTLAIEKINNDVKTLNNAYGLNITEPFNDDRSNRKHKKTISGKQEDMPFDFNDIITEVYNKSLTKVSDTIKTVATIGDIDQGNNPEEFGKNIVKAVLQPIKDIIINLVNYQDTLKNKFNTWVKDNSNENSLKEAVYEHPQTKDKIQKALVSITKYINKIDDLKFEELK